MPTTNEWEKPWFNRGYWIFEHLEDFHLESDETLVLIVMNYLMETNQTIDPDILCAKTNLSANRLDQLSEFVIGKRLLYVWHEKQTTRFLAGWIV